MSAQASTKLPHNLKQNSVEQHHSAHSSTAISVTARIDYIQRFSKQMSLVIDDDPSYYSQIARQYLSNMSLDHKQDVNVAFVSASNKLNDIQMRCRLIEQLFANTLFDPEQSLAVSILRLAKESNDTITVVVEHAQSLSLQIKYELCQLVDVAKKLQNKINVVLFGLDEAAKQVGQNKSIFDKKLSIIDGRSGQVIAMDHARFKPAGSVFTQLNWRKTSLVVLLTSLIIALSWLLLTQHENFTLTALPVNTVAKEANKIESIKPVEQQAQVTNKAMLAKAPQASISEIHLALLGQGNANTQAEVEAAQMSDILQALALTSETAIAEQGADIEKTETSSSQPSVSQEAKADNADKKLSTVTLPITLTEQYYLDAQQGYVVQIAGFSDLSVLGQFLKQNPALEYFSYQKMLNEERFIVLTSQAYSQKADALASLNALPQAIKNRGSFIKAVSTIKGEINTFNR